MSLVQCVGCMEGITSSALKRGTSASASTCACSTRKRCCGAAARRRTPSRSRRARSGWRRRRWRGWPPGSRGRTAALQQLREGLAVHREQAAGGGLVGVGLQQQRAARAQRAVGHHLDRAHGEAAVAQADLGLQGSPRAPGTRPARAASRRPGWACAPRPAAPCRAGSVSSVTPASCTEVSPASAAATRPAVQPPLAHLARRRRDARGHQPLAASTRTPVGAPAASRRMRPPSGSAVAAVRPAVCSARVLAHPAWPSTRVR